MCRYSCNVSRDVRAGLMSLPTSSSESVTARCGRRLGCGVCSVCAASILVRLARLTNSRKQREVAGTCSSRQAGNSAHTAAVAQARTARSADGQGAMHHIDEVQCRERSRTSKAGREGRKGPATSTTKRQQGQHGEREVSRPRMRESNQRCAPAQPDATKIPYECAGKCKNEYKSCARRSPNAQQSPSQSHPSLLLQHDRAKGGARMLRCSNGRKSLSTLSCFMVPSKGWYDNLSFSFLAQRLLFSKTFFVRCVLHFYALPIFFLKLISIAPNVLFHKFFIYKSDRKQTS